MKGNTETKKRSWFLKFLDGIETAGNKLPTPLTIFFYLAVLVVIISGIGAAMGWSATGEMYNSSSGAVEETTIKVVSLFS
ncbi:MAG: AbgT family transporter, partial [Lachnospiraceae bacterium]|nr:AbgT family transporter [Lachnospiraceae bacterium]